METVPKVGNFLVEGEQESDCHQGKPFCLHQILCVQSVQSARNQLSTCFLGCEWTRVVWFACDLAYLQDNPPPNILKWMEAVCEIAVLGERLSWPFSKVARICWHKWKDRNAFVFNNCALNPAATISKIRFSKSEFVEDFPAEVQIQGSPEYESVEQVWCPPGQGTIKANCDAAVNLKDRPGSHSSSNFQRSSWGNSRWYWSQEGSSQICFARGASSHSVGLCHC